MPSARCLGRLVWQIARIFLVIVLIMMLLENFLIFPAPKYPQGEWRPHRIQYEDVFFPSEDGTRLHGWFIDHPKPLAHVVYFHGNGEHLGYLDWLFEGFHELGMAVFAFDYRGYGRSEGRPDERGVCADGRAAQAWLADRAGIRRDQVVLMGRSIGAAVAIDAASANGARGLILENAFTSLPDVAARFYWWLPVRWFMRSRFDCLGKIRAFEGPVFQSHGTSDRLVPFELGKQLFEQCLSTNKQFLALEGIGHNDPPPPDYYTSLHEFLTRLAAVHR